MIRDLEEGDKCFKQSALVEENLYLCEQKTAHMDSLLSTAANKETLYKSDIANYESLLSFKDKRIQDLNNEVSKVKRSKKAITFGGAAFILLILIF